MKESINPDALPHLTLTVVFCNKCGRNGYVQRISPRHFSKGLLCVGGKLKAVTYRRDDATIRNPKGDEL